VLKDIAALSDNPSPPSPLFEEKGVIF